MNPGLITALLNSDIGDLKYIIIAILLIVNHIKKIKDVKLDNESDKLSLQNAFENELSTAHKQYSDDITNSEEKHGIRVRELVTEFSRGACNGNSSHCKYQILFRQMLAFKAHIECIKVEALEAFARDIRQAIEDKNIATNSYDLSTLLLCHNNLIEASFAKGISVIEGVLRNEVIPKKDSSSRARFVLEKFNQFTATVWGHYGDNYSLKVYLLPYSKRREMFESTKKLYLNEFSEFIDIAEEISKDPFGRVNKE
ncbi:MAG: hypothetical protein PF444_06440 [Bacteroidales bacterium]|nr:hypothetical protein [Bacteroidales bacterium]